MSGVVQAGASTAISPLRRAAASLRESFAAGGSTVAGQTSPPGAVAAAGAGGSGAPAWVGRMRRGQAMSRGLSAADHAIRAGDRPSGGSAVDLSEGE